jgi:hypothetical protein
MNVSGNLATHRELMFNSGKTSYLTDAAAILASPELGATKYLAARVIIFAVAFYFTYGLLNLAADLYLKRCEHEFLNQKESVKKDYSYSVEENDIDTFTISPIVIKYAFTRNLDYNNGYDSSSDEEDDYDDEIHRNLCG